MSFTPGPWKYEELDDQIVDSEGRTVASVHYPNQEDYFFPNCSLIASAPELLEALLNLRTFMWSQGYADQTAVMAQADAAIEKAGGAL